MRSQEIIIGSTRICGRFFVFLALDSFALSCVLGGVQPAAGGPLTNYAILHSFGSTNLVGEHPASKLVAGPDGQLYGTTRLGGGAGVGAAVSFNPVTRVYRALHAFGLSEGDGRSPIGSLLLASDGRLYGVTSEGGASARGSVFVLNTDGTGYGILRSLADPNQRPLTGLVEDRDGMLYGTIGYTTDVCLPPFYYCYTIATGTVFRIAKDGSGFTSLAPLGGAPQAPLIEGSDGVLYGTTTHDGPGSAGTVFKLQKDGSGFLVLRENMGNPDVGLVEGSDGRLYGAAPNGGANDAGMVYGLNKDGSGFTVLRSFPSASSGSANPVGPLIQASDGLLYGTTCPFAEGGTIFRLAKDGTGYSILRSFQTANESPKNPKAGLVEGPDFTLYGALQYGGDYGRGALFKIAKDGTSYTVLWQFGTAGGDAKNPKGALVEGRDGSIFGTGRAIFRFNEDGSGYRVLRDWGADGNWKPPEGLIVGSDGMLYGATAYEIFRLNQDGTGYLSLWGGSQQDVNPPIEGSDGRLYTSVAWDGTYGRGTVMSLNRDGSDPRVLWNFGATNNDGSWPYRGVIEGSDGKLYGVASFGGSRDSGIVFRINKDGTGYQILWDLGSGGVTGDPINPDMLLEGSDGRLYGVSFYGGTNAGTAFTLSKDGTNRRVLRNFGATSQDAHNPASALLEGPGGALFGVSYRGGAAGAGTVFKLNKDGSSYQTLWSFAGAGRDGATPWGPLLRGSDGALYGTTYEGGDANFGTVFRLSLTPILTSATWVNERFGFRFETVSGWNYVVQYKDRLSDPVWLSWSTIVGNGQTWIGADTNAYSNSRFYRVIIP